MDRDPRVQASPEAADPAPEAARPDRPRLRVHVIWASVVVAALLVVAPVVLMQTWRQENRKDLSGLADLVSGVFTEDVTHHFFSSVSEAGQGHLLELATLRTNEALSETLTRSWLGIDVESTVRVDVPVVYRYGVPWDSGWTITLRGTEDSGTRCLVEAPALEPFLPPSVDTSGLTIQSHEAMLGPRVADSRNRLIRQLTPWASRMARSPEYHSLVRELARRTLTEYVQQWLLTTELTGVDSTITVDARFADDRPDSLLTAPAEIPLRPQAR